MGFPCTRVGKGRSRWQHLVEKENEVQSAARIYIGTWTRMEISNVTSSLECTQASFWADSSFEQTVG